MKHLFIYVTAVEVLDDYRLLITFEDGVKKTYDLKDKLEGYYFEPLKDPEMFKKVYIEAGALAWPNGAGICHDEIYRNGIDVARKIA